MDNRCVCGEVDCPAKTQTQEPPADVPVQRVVVSSPPWFARKPGHSTHKGYTGVQLSEASITTILERVLRRRYMGKIYGVHDSYCDLVRETNHKPGEAKFCSCESGKKANVEIHEKVKEEISAESVRRAQAKEYADDFVAKIAQNIPGATPESLAKVHDQLMQKWLGAHPVRGVPPLEATDDFKQAIQPQVAEMAKAYAPPKDDQGKAKVFQFFLQQFPLGIIELARHMEKGCADPGHVFLGWQEVENGFERYSDAMLRHLLEEIIATVTDIDREEGVDKAWVEETHAVATAANAMIRLELLLRKRRSLNLDGRRGV